MSRSKSFENLIVWQKAHHLALEIYEITAKFPVEEKFGLVSQMRRAAISIPANIAEGFKKRSIKDKVNFYNISQASLEELKYYVILSKDLKYIENVENVKKLLIEVEKMLSGYIKRMVNEKK